MGPALILYLPRTSSFDDRDSLAAELRTWDEIDAVRRGPEMRMVGDVELQLLIYRREWDDDRFDPDPVDQARS